ncbi:MAG: acyloxyacyl hydrolase [Bacillota bacterium]
MGCRRGLKSGKILVCLALLVSAVVAHADSQNQALGLVVGNGILGGYISDRSYIGLVYDHGWAPGWASRIPGKPSIYLESNLSAWHGCTGGDCGTVEDLGVTAVFRWEIGNIPGSWYEEAGIGGHLISHTRIGPQVYSTGFQFGELAGIGSLVGKDGRYDIGLRIAHESNADYKLPNDGMTFLQLRLAMRW